MGFDLYICFVFLKSLSIYHVRYTYLENDILAKSDVSRHSEVVQLQHVRDVVKPLQHLTYLIIHRETAELYRTLSSGGLEELLVDGWSLVTYANNAQLSPLRRHSFTVTNSSLSIPHKGNVHTTPRLQDCARDDHVHAYTNICHKVSACVA